MSETVNIVSDSILFFVSRDICVNMLLSFCKQRRFSYLDSGCNGVVFVHMNKKDGDPNPKEIVQHMMSSLALTKKHVSRLLYLLKVLFVDLYKYIFFLSLFYIDS